MAVRRAFTLIELLVVISIIALLGGMLLTVIPMVREGSRRSGCTSNQRQIGMAVLAYQQDADGLFPVWSDSTGTMNTTAVSVHTQEFLASLMTLPRALFSCPSLPRIRPAADAAPGVTYGSVAGLAWTTGVATTTSTVYTYDINIPRNAVGSRVMLADRPTSADSTSHGNRAVAVFVDGHGATVARTATTGSSGTTTWFNDGNVVGGVTALFINPDAGQDNIYDDHGEPAQPIGLAGTPHSYGIGSTTRAFLR